MITLKTPAQSAKMREAGLVVAEMLEACRAATHPGVTTAELDRIAADVLRRHGAKSSFLGYHGYPATIPRKSAPAIVMRVTTLPRNSAVGRPGRIPGMKPPYRLMLSATSFGTNVNAV